MLSMTLTAPMLAAALLQNAAAQSAAAPAEAPQSATQAQAQPEAPIADASSANTNTLEEVVVTGTATGLKKLDASFSIPTASLDVIRTANPSIAAHLLQIVP